MDLSKNGLLPMYATKTLFLMLVGLLLLAPQLDASSSSSSSSSCSCSSKAAPGFAQFPFSVIPRVLHITKKTTEISLAAVLSSALNFPGAELVATLKRGKIEFSHSSALKKFLKQQGLTISSLKPLRTYLKGELAKAKKTPGTYVSILDAYLRLGMTNSFTINIIQ